MSASDTSYEVMTYAGDGVEPELRSMTRTAVDRLDVEQFHHYLSASRGQFGFRTATGTWIKRSIHSVGLGKRSWDIVQAVQLEPGVFLDPGEIADLTGNENLSDPGALAARVRAIRKAHGESGRMPRLFITQRNGGYRLMWSAEFSWIWVERIPGGGTPGRGS